MFKKRFGEGGFGSWLDVLYEVCRSGIALCEQYSDVQVDSAKEGSITYIRLCLMDLMNAIDAIDPESIKGK